MTDPALVQVADKFTKEFLDICAQSTRCYIAVGMITDYMFGFAKDRLSKCEDFQVVTGIHMPTPPSVLKAIKIDTEAKKMLSGIYIENFFHPKLYLFEINGSWTAFVGSGNFTKGGWWANEELFVKVTQKTTCDHLLEKFEHWMTQSAEISDSLISKYEQTFNFNSSLEKRKKEKLKDLVDDLRSAYNVNNIDFSTQFFKKEELLAFEKGKTHLDTLEVLSERKLTRIKLYILNDQLIKALPAEWDLHDHYEPEHITSGIETHHHHGDNVHSLWVGYGRSKTQLKRYGKEATPLIYMRMQFILSIDKFGVWLMPGKIGGGRADREYFLNQLKVEENAIKFYNLLSSLGHGYWIEVANEQRDVTSFEDFNSLKKYLLKDNWRYYYFIIGRDYPIGVKELAVDRIVGTCVSDFKKYLPMYNMIRDRSYD